MAYSYSLHFIAWELQKGQRKGSQLFRSMSCTTNLFSHLCYIFISYHHITLVLHHPIRPTNFHFMFETLTNLVEIAFYNIDNAIRLVIIWGKRRIFEKWKSPGEIFVSTFLSILSTCSVLGWLGCLMWTEIVKSGVVTGWLPAGMWCTVMW